MGWKFDNPLYSLATDDQNQDAIKLWEGESLGGIKENNNRLPQPVVGLLVLTIITAFMITFPLWGQRPTTAIYEEYIALMDTPEVQAIADDTKKMEFILLSRIHLSYTVPFFLGPAQLPSQYIHWEL